MQKKNAYAHLGPIGFLILFLFLLSLFALPYVESRRDSPLIASIKSYRHSHHGNPEDITALLRLYVPTGTDEQEAVSKFNSDGFKITGEKSRWYKAERQLGFYNPTLVSDKVQVAMNIEGNSVSSISAKVFSESP